jgi:hypothetical protein
MDVLLPTAAALAGLLVQAHGQGLVGPGGVTQYSGGAARQQRGYGTVREPAMGFFVGGSTLTAMNGVYKRVQAPNANIKHTGNLVYRKWPANEQDDESGWTFMLADGPSADSGAAPDYEVVGGKKSEWLIIDDEFRDRFGHGPGPPGRISTLSVSL